MAKYFFLATFLFIFLTKGCCGCSTTDIDVIVGLSGRQVKGKPEYAVLVYNTCDCPVIEILLSCPPEFQTVEPIDPEIFQRVTGDRCLFNKGRVLQPGTFLGFSYAWDEEFHFPASDCTPAC